MKNKSNVDIAPIQSVSSIITIDSEPDYTNKPRDHLIWSIVNVLCCWLGGLGILCSLPALFLSCKINEHLKLDDCDRDTLRKYSGCSKLLNLIASAIYIFFSICLTILVFFFIYELLILF